ncbi:MAG: YdeI/OmpD-associated family protein, partial [Flavisolibacter sp.]|nr:YdeI/OmpD-associated family protein [Flavisolibacter sp.]
VNSLPDWSKAICNKLRTIILNADPSIAEDWKWGPNYYRNGMVCGYGAFQKHVKFTFFNGSGMKDPKGLFNHCVDNEFSRSIKYVSEDEIDEKLLTQYIKESVAVNKKGFKREIKDKTVEVPAELQQALSKNKKAQQFFDGLSYGYKKEFVEHVTTAKQDNTRIARIAKVVDYCAEGKKLNDKYKV